MINHLKKARDNSLVWGLSSDFWNSQVVITHCRTILILLLLVSRTKVFYKNVHEKIYFTNNYLILPGPHSKQIYLFPSSYKAKLKLLHYCMLNLAVGFSRTCHWHNTVYDFTSEKKLPRCRHFFFQNLTPVKYS